MFTGQAREFPSLSGQSERGEGSSELSLSSLVYTAATHPSVPLRLADPHTQADPGQDGGGSSSSSTCLALHHHHHRPSLRLPCLPGPGLRFSRCRHRCHHVRLFPPGLPQLARRLLRDGWAPLFFSLYSVFFSLSMTLSALFPPS